jgi:hypothetical protein
MVALALRGGAPEATPELKAFIAKKRLPAGTEKELVEFGITTLDQLKEVKEDTTQGGGLDQLKAKLTNSGIRGATKQFDDIKVADIEQEIAEVSSPEGKEGSQRSQKLAEAIKEVEQLREKVAGAADRTEVQAQYDAVLETIKDVSGADFTSANAAALKTKEDLSNLLKNTIDNVTKAKKILDAVEKTPRPLSEPSQIFAV